MSFQRPNFRCRVSVEKDPKKKFSRLVYAEDSNKAEEYLQRRQYTIHKIQQYDFKKWEEAAKRELATVMRAFGGHCASKKPWKFKAIWSPLKEVLIDEFHGKCAYCDAAFAHVAYGDVEHYRPKAEVHEDDLHPGYYWLAYNPENYLPACQKCNEEFKKTHFPVSGKRAYKPSDPLEQEAPDLLNPYQDNFHKFLKFASSKEAFTKAGRAEPRDPQSKVRAEATIKCYGLNRGWLVEWRIREQAMVRARAQQAYMLCAATESSQSVLNLRDSILSGPQPFVAAAVDEVEHYATSNRFWSPFSGNGAGWSS